MKKNLNLYMLTYKPTSVKFIFSIHQSYEAYGLDYVKLKNYVDTLTTWFSMIYRNHQTQKTKYEF